MKLKEHDTKSRRLKEKHKEDYRIADKEVKKLARKDKRAYIEDIARQAEEAAEKREQGQLYKLTKLVSGKYRVNTSKYKNDNLLTTEKEQEARWTEHFQEILNRSPPDQIIDIPETENDLEVNTEIPTTDEIVTAIKSLKNGKSPGLDNLNAELFKADHQYSYPCSRVFGATTKYPTTGEKVASSRYLRKGH